MNKRVDNPSKTISALYFLCLSVMVFIPSMIYTYLIRGGQLSGLSPATPPSALMGLEELRATLFRRGLSLPDGFADPIVGPLISQVLAVSDTIREQLPQDLVLPAQMQTHILLCLCMLGSIWGTALLYEKWRTVFSASILASISLGLVSHYAVDGLWFLFIFTWTSVGLTASWRDPGSSLRAALCGFTLSIGVAASPLFLPIAIVYWLLSFWPRPRQAGEHWWKAIMLLPPCAAMLSFCLGMTPWLFRGRLSHPPLTIEQYSSPDLWLSIVQSVEILSPLRQTYSIFAPLAIMSGLTFMSAHTHRVTWSRRGIGLGALLIVALIMSPFIGWWCTLPPLLWVSVHPWSPIGTFLLLPFRPVVKRFVSLIIFIAILAPSVVRVMDEFQERRVEKLSFLQQEQISLSTFLNDMSEMRKLWVVGQEAYPLYAMTRLEGSALLPAKVKGNEHFKLKNVHSVLKSELIDVVVLSESERALLTTNVGLKRFLEEDFRRLPASDYRWLNKSSFSVYIKGDSTAQPSSLDLEEDDKNSKEIKTLKRKGEASKLSTPSLFPPKNLDIKLDLTDNTDTDDSVKDDRDTDNSDQDDSVKDDTDKDDSVKDDSDQDDSDQDDSDQDDSDQDDSDQDDSDQDDSDQDDSNQDDSDQDDSDQDDSDTDQSEDDQ